MLSISRCSLIAGKRLVSRRRKGGKEKPSPATTAFTPDFPPAQCIHANGFRSTRSKVLRLSSPTGAPRYPSRRKVLVDDRIKKLKTPRDCEIFGRNAKTKGREDLAIRAMQRSVELRAAEHGALSDAERDCLKAIYAYEEILYAKHGKRVRASRTWRMIKDRGIIAAIERAVDRDDGRAGFTELKAAGLDNFAFEAV